MEKNKGTKIIAIIALIVAVIGLSLGFAAFSSILTIQSSAEVKPNESDFKVVFATSTDSGTTVTATPTGEGASGDSATISDTQITGLKAKFTKPGQSVTYTFKAKNVSNYDAYLKSINFSGTPISCSPETGTTANLVTEACKGIHVTVTVGADNAKAVASDGSNGAIDNHKLAKQTGTEPVTVKIEYRTGSGLADGKFNVTIGDVKLNYSTQDS